MIKVIGKQSVNGKVIISGAKNAALPILAASILSNDGLTLRNIPPLSDTLTMLELLENLGASYSLVNENDHSLLINIKTDSINNFVAPYEMVKKMRASILVLGALLTRFGRAKVSLPGGCAIGVRPVNLHISGLQALGADIELESGYLIANAPNGLRGAEFSFSTKTVTGTENIIMAATLASGVTVLKNCANEPEIVDLANCLNAMGAKIAGHGTDEITIHGVSSLHSAEHSVLHDRIEAGTYAIAAAITAGKLELIGEGLDSMLSCFWEKLQQAGVKISKTDNGILVQGSEHISPVDIETGPYPDFPTDLQAQMMALMCLARGQSRISENIWENRFMHVAEFVRMGADINVVGSSAVVNGIKSFVGTRVIATDLRASFALVLAAIAADGETIVDDTYHLDRGYCCVKDKLSQCGVVVEKG